MHDLARRPLFIFEMANNHMGSVEHACRIVDAMREAALGFPFHFAVKLQYRDLDSFIHPVYRRRFDLKFVRRFSETRLSSDDFKRIKDAICQAGFTAICTPFDEASVDRIEEHGFDFIKIPSCSLTDWPLLERIAHTGKPLIGSTAGMPLEDIDRVVSFFRHRGKAFSLTSCVAEYPTRDDNLQLGQIRLLQKRYPDLEIGYSTHERPDHFGAVQVAVGLGATIFEKHVGLPTSSIALNAYSATPAQVRQWLSAAASAFRALGDPGQRYQPTPSEAAGLRELQRSVFVNRDVQPGERLAPADLFFATPCQPGQILAGAISKYTDFCATAPIPAGHPLLDSNTRACDRRRQVYQIVGEVRKMLKRSKVPLPGQCELEISHHYGIDNFPKFGLTMVTVVNREYCKKVIVLLPGQSHPEQYHKQKEETFHILHGEIAVRLDGVEQVRKTNDVLVIPRGVKHQFDTRHGAVIEEVSSNHSQEDSFYTDPAIAANQNRKTLVTYWMD